MIHRYPPETFEVWEDHSSFFSPDGVFPYYRDQFMVGGKNLTLQETVEQGYTWHGMVTPTFGVGESRVPNLDDFPFGIDGDWQEDSTIRRPWGMGGNPYENLLSTEAMDEVDPIFG